MSIGEKIKSLRKKAGITQEMLAKYLDVSRQTISKWESSGAEPDWRSMIKISQFFGLPLEEFVEQEEEQEEQKIIEEEKITYKELMKAFQVERRKTIVTVLSFCLILVGVLSMLVITIVNSSLMSVQYMLYRFIVAAEYAFLPANYIVPVMVSVIAIVIGVLLLFVAKRK